MALMHMDFFSNVLGMCVQADVIIPQRTTGQIGMEGKVSDGKYPTLYLLHGMSDDHTIWQRRTSIERYVSEMGIAVVMPTTHLGWYTDTQYGLKYYTYIAEELPQICRSFFKGMSDKREDTFAAGLSMGGYGAFKLGLVSSDTFGAVASLSGALNVESFIKRNDDLTRGIFGFGGCESILNSDNNLFYAAKKLAESGKPKPKMYQWCGTEDFLYEDNLKMRDYLLNLGYNLIYEESSGTHEWKYWDDKIQDVLKWLPIK